MRIEEITTVADLDKTANVFAVEVPVSAARAIADGDLEIFDYKDFEKTLDLAQGDVFNQKGKVSYLVLKIVGE